MGAKEPLLAPLSAAFASRARRLQEEASSRCIEQLVHPVAPAATLAIQVAKRESRSDCSFALGDEIEFAYARGSRPGGRRQGVVTGGVTVAKSGDLVQVRVDSETKSYQPEHTSEVIFIRRGSE